MGTSTRGNAGEFERELEQADDGVPGHSERVARYAVAIAEEMGLDPQAIETIRQAATLHDIGKVALSSDIVGKLGRLTEQEFEVMKMHATIGLGLIERSPELKAAAPLIRHHHERLDGKGYPDGLKGDDIPLGARIIAVCEAYDMMVNEVPYKPTKSPAEALDELRRCMGTQFDAQVVECFARVLSRTVEAGELRPAA
jgi:putative nucleotidyltransferase with HDIG domain